MRQGSINEVIVVGAGPAGLATSRELRRRGVEHLVLERGEGVGYTWTKLYDSLTLHTGKHLSALPGLRFSPSTPLFPSRQQFVEYLRRYAALHELPVLTSCEVQVVDRADRNGWALETPRGKFTCRTLVLATGILSNPYRPQFAGMERFRGKLIHSVDYKRPEGYVGRRILVVGVGNSGGEISSELAAAGAKVTVAARSGNRVIPRSLLGVPIQYYGNLLSVLPQTAQRAIVAATGALTQRLRGGPVLPPPSESQCPDVPLIGFGLVDAIRKGSIRIRGAINAFTENGVMFADGSSEPFDRVILATGYRAALDMLGDLVRFDTCGFALREQRVVSRDQAGLFYVGQNYDSRGGLINIAGDSKIVGRMIAEALSGRRDQRS